MCASWSWLLDNNADVRLLGGRLGTRCGKELGEAILVECKDARAQHIGMLESAPITDTAN